MRRLHLVLAGALALAACTAGQATYSAAVSFDAAEKAATAAISAGLVDQQQAGAIKACDQAAYTAIEPVIAAERSGAAVAPAILGGAAAAESGFETCLTQNGVSLPMKGS